MGELHAFFKRQERAERKRQRELERQAKEQAKLSVLEQARFEVAENENAIELLLSVHKEQNPPVDWQEFAHALPPHRPFRHARHELAAHFALHALVEPGARLRAIEQARLADVRDYREAFAQYEHDLETWQLFHALARRVLAGEKGAYEEALQELSPLNEITGLGVSAAVTVHTPKIASCELQVNGREVVPSDLKTLTSTGKLSVKSMPKARFHDIYQDYVCGCALRVTREMFAILPLDIVLVTANVGRLDAHDRAALLVPVLSIALSRDACAKLDFDRLDPSDTVETLTHRGDVKASKKTGEFVPITPLIPSDVIQTAEGTSSVANVRSDLRMLRDSLREALRLPSLDVGSVASEVSP